MPHFFSFFRIFGQVIFLNMFSQHKQIVEQAWADRSMLADAAVKATIREVVEAVDKGQLRTAEPLNAETSEWQVNEIGRAHV